MPIQGWTDQTSVNWDDVSTEPPPPLQPGLYKAVIAKAEPGQTKGNKNAISIELAVDGQYGGDTITPPRKMFDNLVLSAEAAFKVKQLAAAAGVTPPANFGLDAVTDFCNALVDSSGVHLRSKLSEWQGKTNHKVDRYLSGEQAALAASGGEAPSEAAPAARRKRKAE